MSSSKRTTDSDFDFVANKERKNNVNSFGGPLIQSRKTLDQLTKMAVGECFPKIARLYASCLSHIQYEEASKGFCRLHKRTKTFVFNYLS